MKKLFFILILFLITSCVTRQIERSFIKMGGLEENPVLEELPYEDKEVLFLGMVHIAKPEFYKNAKQKIDSLEKQGFFVFHEGLYLRREDRVINPSDTIYYRKLKKLTGLDALKEYSKVYPSLVNKYGLVDQPDYDELGLTTANSQPVDISIVDQIKIFEKQKGEIFLDDCDYEYKLGIGDYHCVRLPYKLRKYYINEIMVKVRNEFILQNIKESEQKKILVVYGKLHYNGLKDLTENQSI